MGAIQFSGMSSGLDTAGIIDALVQVDAQRLAPYTEANESLEAELTAVGRVKSYLTNFATATEEIKDLSDFFLSSLSSSDESILTATATGNADLGQGSVNIEVLQMAVNEKTQSNSFTDSSSDRGIDGSFSLNGKNVSVVSSDSLAEIRDKINGTDDIGVVASIIKVSESDYRLTLTNDEAGTEGTVFGDGNGVLQSLGLTSSGPAIDTTSTDYDSELAAVGVEGSFTINGDQEVSVLATDNLEEIITKINTATGASTATLGNVDGKYQINLDGATTLTADTDSVLGSLGLITSGKNILQDGANSQIKIDGSIVVERTSNSIDDVIEGLEIDLEKAEAGEVVTVDFGRDYDAVADKIQSFVTAYNVVVNYIGDQSGYDEDTDTAGSLANSRISTRVISDLRSIINTDHSDYLPDGYGTLAHIGITSDQSKGTLNIDSDKLEEAMTSNFDAFIKMFANTESTSNADLNLGKSSDDTQSGKYYADPTTNQFFDITEAEDAASILPTSLDADSAGDQYFLTTDNKMYTWSGSAWDAGAAVTSATVTVSGGINTVTDGNGMGIGFDGSSAGVITFTKGFSGLFDDIVNENMLNSTDGYFKSEDDRINNTIDSNEDQYDRLDARLTSLRERLVSQFAQLEMYMAEMQTQATSLASMPTTTTY